jgi:uncharacterized protein
MLRHIYVFLFLLLTTASFGQDFPAPMSPPRLVNDFAGALNSSEEDNLEQKLVAYNDSTSTQIAVIIVRTTAPLPASDYALEIGRRWGVGQKKKNNGIVLLWATDDRKIYIATNQGMEGVIPDVIAKRIIRQVISPRFKNQMYYQGLDEGIDEIIRYASGEYQADPNASSGGDGGGLGVLIFLIIFIFIIFIIVRSNKGGGGGGGRGFSSGGGFIPYATYSGWGSSSGSWGGGSDSGGGFGGFGGGGGFSGGGAGGDY